VALVRPALPPIESGLPVMTAGTMRRLMIPYWSIIQPMTIWFV